MSLERYQELIEKNGYDLSGAGVGGYAFERAPALEAVSILRELSVPILGGDVYANRSQLELTYDNWYVNRAPDEEDASYALRSADVASNFIEKYHEPVGIQTLYRLTVPVEFEHQLGV